MSYKMSFGYALNDAQHGHVVRRTAWPRGKEMSNGANGVVVVRDDAGSLYWADALTMDDHLAVDWTRTCAPITADMIESVRAKCSDALRGAVHEWWHYSQRVNTPAVPTTEHHHRWGINPYLVAVEAQYAANSCAKELASALSGANSGLDIASVLAHGVSNTYSHGTARDADADLRAAGAIKTTWFYLDDMQSDRRFAILAGTAPQDKPLQYYMDGGDTVHVADDVTQEALERWRSAMDRDQWQTQDQVHFGISYKLAVWVRPGTRMLVALEVK